MNIYLFFKDCTKTISYNTGNVWYLQLIEL